MKRSKRTPCPMSSIIGAWRLEVLGSPEDCISALLLPFRSLRATAVPGPSGRLRLTSWVVSKEGGALRLSVDMVVGEK